MEVVCGAVSLEEAWHLGARKVFSGEGHGTWHLVPGRVLGGCLVQTVIFKRKTQSHRSKGLYPDSYLVLVGLIWIRTWVW